VASDQWEKKDDDKPVYGGLVEGKEEKKEGDESEG